MSDKFKKRMRKTAGGYLIRMLRKEQQPLNPCTQEVPYEVRNLIGHQLDIYPYPEEGEVSGPKVEGIAIAHKLFDGLLQQAYSFVDEEVWKRKIAREEMRVGIELTNETIKILEYRVCEGLIGKSRGYWRGAAVHVTPERIPGKKLGWSHASDFQVVTGSRDLALSISWLFEQARDTMKPFLNYLNKVEFYGELALSAMVAIDQDGEVNDQDVFVAILARTKAFQRQWLRMYRHNNYNIENKL